MTTKSNLRVLAVVAALASTASCGGADKTDGTATADGLMDRVSVIARVDATPEDITADVYSPIEFAAAALQETCSSKPAIANEWPPPGEWISHNYRLNPEYDANDIEDDGNGLFSMAMAWLGDWSGEAFRRSGREPVANSDGSDLSYLCNIDPGPVEPFLEWAKTHTVDPD